jgi:ubiquinone/menaquinone biosynthesis C-methylase UbiE
MKQNVYDNPDFFNGYRAMRENKAGLNEALEQPAMLSLLPDVRGCRILDLGCGAGDFCRKLKSLGANSIVGVDISSKMLELAIGNIVDRIKFFNMPMEELDFSAETFELVVSSLALHYVADLHALFKKVYSWLKPSGIFLFSMEHPVVTSSQGIHQGWIQDKLGNKSYWPLDCYSQEGRRESHWFIDGVVKYHRTISTIINGLIDLGFTILAVQEPVASEEEEQKRPALKEERRRPPFLVVKSGKTLCPALIVSKSE